VHGKVKVKIEELGTLGGQFVAIFYLQRNDEFSELREQFMQMIEQEEMHHDSLPVGFEYSDEAKKNLQQRAQDAGEELDKRAAADGGLKKRLDALFKEENDLNQKLASTYDGSYGDALPCECDHPYYRHFDSYDAMEPVGCKYCNLDECPGFRAKK
jgi:hypothetical protein